jgi:fibrillarin-like pre-rRNA processing protein
VEFSKTEFRKLSHLSKRRDNIVPILADAFHPERYQAVVPRVSILYQDVSQKDQLGLFSLNAGKFLKNGGTGYLMLKARSMDVTAKPEDIYDKATSFLKESGFVVEYIEDLSPFQRDHAAIRVKSVN